MKISDSNEQFVIKQLEKEMATIVAENTVPGASFCIVTNEGEIWSKSFGYTDLNLFKKVTGDSIFNIGSTSKTFTAFAFMLAVQDGLVKLDDPVLKYYPEFEIFSREGENEKKRITFRHLLSHRSGLPREPKVGGVFGVGKYSFEEMVSSLKDCWMVAPVGNRYWYSNIGFDLVAYVLQRITDMEFPKWVKLKLGDPVGMTSLSYWSEKMMDNPLTVLATTDGKRHTEYYQGGDYGCGVVWISNTDLAKFLILLLNEGTYQSKPILQKSLFREMITTHFINENAMTYGLGVDINEASNIRILSHGGGAWGYSCSMAWVPELGFGLAIQSNQESMLQPGDPHFLKKRALEELIKLNGMKWILPNRENVFEEPSEVDVAKFKNYTGLYIGLWNTGVEVKYRENKLFFQWGSDIELIPHN